MGNVPAHIMCLSQHDGDQRLNLFACSQAETSNDLFFLAVFDCIWVFKVDQIQYMPKNPFKKLDTATVRT